MADIKNRMLNDMIEEGFSPEEVVEIAINFVEGVADIRADIFDNASEQKKYQRAIKKMQETIAILKTTKS